MNGNDAADSNENIFAAELFEFVDEFGQKRVVTCGKRTEPDNVNVVIDSILRGLLRSLEERPDVDVPAHVRETGGDNFCAAVVFSDDGR